MVLDLQADSAGAQLRWRNVMLHNWDEKQKGLPSTCLCSSGGQLAAACTLALSLLPTKAPYPGPHLLISRAVSMGYVYLAGGPCQALAAPQGLKATGGSAGLGLSCHYLLDRRTGNGPELSAVFLPKGF
jgi:hypothetical protein